MRFPLQVVGAAGPAWRESDLSGLGGAEQEVRLVELRDDEGREPAGGEGEAVLRAHLVKLGAGRHSIELSVSVRCADAESMRVLAGEWAACYGTELGGRGATTMPSLTFSSRSGRTSFWRRAATRVPRRVTTGNASSPMVRPSHCRSSEPAAQLSHREESPSERWEQT
jgi:hypothetical protein